MIRKMGMVNAAIVVSQLACAGALALPADQPRQQGTPHSLPHGNFAEPSSNSVAALDGVTRGRRWKPANSAELAAMHVTYHARIHHAHRTAFARRSVVPPEVGTPVDPAVASPDAATNLGQSPAGAQDPGMPQLAPDTLTRQEIRVSHIAAMNGDKTYLMVDKAVGRILLFENGQPVYFSNALTGASTGDNLPPNAQSETFDQLESLADKVTPAGRFTVSRHFDKEYGPLFDINEIKGADWGIAIHQVYLGIPAEHRDVRLQSPYITDKNVTFGCINVSHDAVQVLVRELPENRPTPLYVLPRDPSQTGTYFVAHTS